MVTAAALRAHLVGAGIAGVVATPREKSLRSYRLFVAGDPRQTLGLEAGAALDAVRSSAVDGRPMWGFA